jgi:hypothetical protein
MIKFVMFESKFTDGIYSLSLSLSHSSQIIVLSQTLTLHMNCLSPLVLN